MTSGHQRMKLIPTEFDGVALLEPKVWHDARGCFFESYNQRAFADAGLTLTFVQDNHSYSVKDVLRGIHYQAPPYAQDKLVRVLSGEVFDVVVDLRRGSPRFGQWLGFNLSAANRRMLLISKGYGHGFCALSNGAEVAYKCTSFYAPEATRGLRWDDPDVAIDWPVADPILSAQDQQYPSLAELPNDFVYGADN